MTVLKTVEGASPPWVRIPPPPLYVHDPRHRYSYELRPDEQLDATIRELAAHLEHTGALAPGMATAPRFQPHLTLLRADRCDAALVARVALVVAPSAALQLTSPGSFGAGRIGWLAPADTAPLLAARNLLFRELGEEHIDPMARARDPWTSHLTVAYAVEPDHRDAIESLLAAHLPLTGRWASVQCWDLDVRPTVCVAEHGVGAAP